MPFGVRSSVFALLLCSTVAAQAAGEKGSTWTDPPARPAEAAKPDSKSDAKPDAAPDAAPLAQQTPAALSGSRREEASAVRRTSPVTRKVASRRHRVRVAKRPQHIATSSVPRVLTAAPARPAVRRYVYRVYSAAGFPPSYDDERLDRLSTAVGSGYLVMRRRTVEYPDGRVIRYYRPAEDGDE